MQAVSRILTRVALFLLLVAGGMWILQRPYFAINQFRFVGDVKQLDEHRLRGLVDKHLLDGLSGGFFSMELRDVQSSLSEITWIKSTSIRRVWPHEVEVNVEAYQPIAAWGDRYLSAEGRLFEGQIPAAVKQQMLSTSGPEAASELVAQQIPVFQTWLKPTGWQIKSIHLSERYSWRIGLGNGLEIELGRADTPTALEERVARLVNSAQFIDTNLGDGGGYIDLRYPNGFAMRTDKLHRVAVAQNTVKTGEQHD